MEINNISNVPHCISYTRKPNEDRSLVSQTDADLLVRAWKTFQDMENGTEPFDSQIKLNEVWSAVMNVDEENSFTDLIAGGQSIGPICAVYLENLGECDGLPVTFLDIEYKDDSSFRFDWCGSSGVICLRIVYPEPDADAPPTEQTNEETKEE